MRENSQIIFGYTEASPVAELLDRYRGSGDGRRANQYRLGDESGISETYERLAGGAATQKYAFRQDINYNLLRSKLLRSCCCEIAHGDASVDAVGSRRFGARWWLQQLAFDQSVDCGRSLLRLVSREVSRSRSRGFFEASPVLRGHVERAFVELRSEFGCQ